MRSRFDYFPFFSSAATAAWLSVPFNRFGCIWDRRGEENVPFDERMKPYVLRYYLVDDTIMITDAEFESNQRRGLYSSSRAQEAVLLRRQKLPKGLRRPALHCSFLLSLFSFLFFLFWLVSSE